MNTMKLSVRQCYELGQFCMRDPLHWAAREARRGRMASKAHYLAFRIGGTRHLRMGEPLIMAEGYDDDGCDEDGQFAPCD